MALNTAPLTKLMKQLDDVEPAFMKALQDKVKSYTPVAQGEPDAGQLKDGWVVTNTTNGATLENAVKEAVAVEFGHRTRLGTGVTRGDHDKGISFVPPVAMLGRTMLEAPAILKDTIKEVGI